MNGQDDTYEDELDRMRQRRSRRRSGAAPSSSRRRAETYHSRRREETPIPRKRQKRKKHGIAKLILILAAVFIGYLGFAWFRDGGYWTVAVFGVDSRDGNTGKGALSDVEMLCSINRKTGEIRLVSVFRDTYLRINSDPRYDKINEAYFLGGHKQATEALETNLDLVIDDYATFNWKAVVDAINVLGGIDLEITDKEFAYINSFITETVNSTGVASVHLEHSGMNHLDGVQAVAYARLRLMDTDFNRTERQRKVLGLAMEKAKAADKKTLIGLVRVVYPEISTSIGLDDMINTAKNAKKYYIGQTSGFPFSHQETKIDKKSCVIPTTLETNVIQLHGYLYDDESYQPSKTVQEISSYIAQRTGLGDPGKDTETGKNVGAEGNTGSGGHAVQTLPQTGMQPTPESLPAPTEETVTETAEETIESLETHNETEAVQKEEEIEQTQMETEEALDGGRTNLITQPSDAEETTISGPGEHREPAASQEHGKLEAPGTQTESAPEYGPGL